MRKQQRQAQAPHSGADRQQHPHLAGTDLQQVEAQPLAQPHAVPAAQQWEAGMQAEPVLQEIGRGMDMASSSSQLVTLG